MPLLVSDVVTITLAKLNAKWEIGAQSTEMQLTIKNLPKASMNTFRHVAMMNLSWRLFLKFMTPRETAKPFYHMRPYLFNVTDLGSMFWNFDMLNLLWWTLFGLKWHLWWNVMLFSLFSSTTDSLRFIWISSLDTTVLFWRILCVFCLFLRNFGAFLSSDAIFVTIYDLTFHFSFFA